ncbi:MAG: 3-deoxy-8-phosphooctulonate synthase [Bacteroidetes bacterium]|nr:MAG: 3-deoxy-8-phosphooctulonate synthase [Bacteroidota bacterium]
MTPDDLYAALTGPQPFFILGPCVMESYALLDEVASEVARLRDTYGLTCIFKSSFDKANRTSAHARRGPGLDQGKAWLAQIRETYDLPVTTDVHESHQPAQLAGVVDVMQIPAFLCRQTDLLLAAAATGAVVNIKKAQFLSGADMFYPAEKVREAGNPRILLTERGTVMGYNNLVVDFRNIPAMKAHGYPVVMDCTHAVQRPGGGGGMTTGDRAYVPAMARAAQAFGADGYFMEVHPDPDRAWSDGPNMLPLKDLEPVIQSLL